MHLSLLTFLTRSLELGLYLFRYPSHWGAPEVTTYIAGGGEDLCHPSGPGPALMDAFVSHAVPLDRNVRVAAAANINAF